MKKHLYFLKEVENILTDRGKTYGHPSTFLESLAKRWSITLGIDVTPDQIVRCMIDMKLERYANNKNHKDSLIDIVGYAAILNELLVDEE